MKTKTTKKTAPKGAKVKTMTGTPEYVTITYHRPHYDPVRVRATVRRRWDGTERSEVATVVRDVTDGDVFGRFTSAHDLPDKLRAIAAALDGDRAALDRELSKRERSLTAEQKRTR